MGDTNSSFAAEIEWIEIVWLRVAYGYGAYKIGTIDCPLEEHASYLRFWLWGHNMFECLTDVDNGTVKFGIGRAVGRRVIAKVEMASDAATGFGQDQVGGIGINTQDHVTHVVSHDGIWVWWAIVK